MKVKSTLIHHIEEVDRLIGEEVDESREDAESDGD